MINSDPKDSVQIQFDLIDKQRADFDSFSHRPITIVFLGRKCRPTSKATQGGPTKTTINSDPNDSMLNQSGSRETKEWGLTARSF